MSEIPEAFREMLLKVVQEATLLEIAIMLLLCFLALVDVWWDWKRSSLR